MSDDQHLIIILLVSTGVPKFNKRRTYSEEEKKKVEEAFTDFCGRNVNIVKTWLIRQYGESWRQLPDHTLTTWIGNLQAREKRAAERKEKEVKGEEVPPSPPPKKRGAKLWIDDEDDDAYLEQKVRRYIINVDVGLDAEHLCGFIRGLLEVDDRLKTYRYKKGQAFQVSRHWLQGRLAAWKLSHRKGTTAARKLPENYEQVIDLFICRLSHDIHTLASKRDDAKVSYFTCMPLSFDL